LRAEVLVLLSGAVGREFEDDSTPHDMRPGDYMLIESHCRLRVAWTHVKEQTIWLAIYQER
jgi:cupin 2 domain-containing protein